MRSIMTPPSPVPSTTHARGNACQAKDQGNANANANANAKAQADAEYEERIKAKLAEQRRRHASEELRRVRRKQQMIEMMRKKVDELQKEYEELCKRADQHAHHRIQTQHHATTTTDMGYYGTTVRKTAIASPPSSPTTTARTAETESPTKSLWCLAREIRRLESENTELRERMDHCKHFEHVVHTMLSDDLSCCSGRRATGGALPLPTPRCMGSLFPLTMDDCTAIIQQDYMHYVVRNLPNFFDDTINPKLQLGWRGFMHIDHDCTVNFQLTKRRPLPMHVDFSFLINLYWNCLSGVLPARISSIPVQIDTLQRLSDNAVVVRRCYTNVHTGKTLRAYMLMYRLQLGHQLYLIGGVPLPHWREDPWHDHDAVEPISYHFHTLAGPADQDKVNGREIHVRFCKWGTLSCCSRSDAQLLANEAHTSAVGYENIIAFQCDRKLIE